MIKWISANIKPEGTERKMLLFIKDYPCGYWSSIDTCALGWWKHEPGCFAFNDIENANHLVTHYSELNEPDK